MSKEEKIVGQCKSSVSEAMEWFGEQWVEYGIQDTVMQIKDTKEYKTIKQALIKAQEQEEDINHYKGTVENLRRDNALLKEIKNKQEKVLDIIKERQVNIALLVTVKDVEEYNFYIPYEEFEKYLTKEEFDLLKGYFEKNIQKCMFNSQK